MAVWAVPLVSSLDVLTSSKATYDSAKDPLLNTQKYLSALHTEIPEGEQNWVNREGRKAEMGAKDTTWSSVWVSGEGRNQVLACTLLSPEEQKGRENILAWVVSTYCCWTQWQGQPLSTEVQPQLSGSRCCQAEKQSHGTWPPTLTLPEIPVGPRKSYSSECRGL